MVNEHDLAKRGPANPVVPEGSLGILWISFIEDANK